MSASIDDFPLVDCADREGPCQFRCLSCGKRMHNCLGGRSGAMCCGGDCLECMQPFDQEPGE